MASGTDDRVSRRKYEREAKARLEAERLLEEKSRELFLANQRLSAHSEELETTVQKRTTELQQAVAKAEAASAMRSRFVATMSHEIRTPLGGLLGMIDLVLGDETDPTKREYLEYAKTSGQALRRIVNDVLDFSKMEAGAFQFKEENVDLRALIEVVTAMARANLSDEPERLIAEVDDSVPNLFLGDATRVRQVVFNLVSNAIRYSSSGTINVRATLLTRENQSWVRVEVSDHGVGIPLRDQENLFKDFTQIQNELTSAAQGTGLGLAISKRIVEGAGGKIGVISEAGQGSTFWFELPAKAVTQDQLSSITKSEAPVTTSIEGARVLLAEDNRINQKLLMSFLTKMGAEVELAENGQIAVEKFSPVDFDLVLMDVAMPVMDGLQAIREIREAYEDSEIPPIALLTAHVMETIEREGQSVGVDRVLSKPIAFDELRAAVGELLSTSEDLQENTAEQSKLAVLDLMTPEAADSLLVIMSEPEISDFIVAFLEDARLSIRKMTSGLKVGDIAEVTRSAHSLKGAAGLLGFAEISELAGHIEDADGDLDVEILQEMTDVIERFLADISTAVA